MPYEALETWHDFFGLVGASAATLVGLTFVAASVGSSVFTEERQVGLRTLLSPTVVAFAGVLAACIVGVLPALGRGVSSALFSIVGSLGALYSMFIWRSMVREGIAGKLDIEDRLWYAFAPALAYVTITLAGVAFALVSKAATLLLAAGICLLLLAGIRNAWDMTTWVVLRRQG